MAEDSDLEKTEPASARRLSEARNKGNSPRSRELNTFAILIVAGATLLMMGTQLTAGMTDLLRRGLTFDRTALSSPDFMWNSLIHSTLDMLQLFLPFLLVLVIAALAAPILLGGLDDECRGHSARFWPIESIERNRTPVFRH